MKKLRKIVAAGLFLYLSGFLFAGSAFAHCPLCVVGAGAGLSLSRIIGIDDSISGIWMASFLGALSIWFTNSLKKKYFPFQKIIFYLVIIGGTIFSFYRFGLINEHNGLIFNLPKLTFGMIAGGTAFYLTDKLSAFIKERRGKVLFNYQGVVFSLGAMLLLSVAVYVFINYFY